MQNTVYMCLFAFSRNFTNRFSVNEFSQDCSGQYFVIRHVFEKVYLLSYGSESPWPIRLHDSSECSFSFTTWLFGMILIDIPSVSVVLPVVLEMEKETVIGNSVLYIWSSWYLHWWLCFIDQWTANTTQDFDCRWL